MGHNILTGVLYLWFALTFLSIIFVLWDQITTTPSMRIMTLAWVLIILYTGPFGLFIYLLTCRQPLPQTHDQFIQTHWKQSIGSLIHCVAGDATAIIFMAVILYYFQLPNGIELIIEYIAAYLFGLFIFQALFMKSMYGSYKIAVKKTIFPETVSMNFVMMGMFPVMLIGAHYFPESTNPLTLYFWGRMALATIVAGFAAYPINAWMVKKQIKHGMMSRQEKTTKEAMPKTDMSKMKMPSVSTLRLYIITIITYIAFICVIWITSQIIPVHFLKDQLIIQPTD
jgi:hypothetical protein